jgi:hypothetical protein
MKPQYINATHQSTFVGVEIEDAPPKRSNPRMASAISRDTMHIPHAKGAALAAPLT